MRKKTNLKKWVVVCIFIFTTAGSIAVADTIYVDDNAPGGGNGSSWNLAYQSLQDALSDASSGDQIYVAQGTYKPTTETTRTISFELKTGVELYGGYAGYGTDNPNERDIELYETILSGDIDTVDDDSDNSYHVVVGSGTDSTAVLDGFTITGGNADHTSWPHDVGGGMYNNDGSPTVSNCTFSENIADDRGGGMANYGGSGPIVTNCSFLTNESDDLGGGIHNSTGSNITITDCIFTENTALNGGGVSNYISHPSITECTFSDNSAVYRGGGVYNDDSDPNVTGCTFSDNSATDTTDGRGGAMANYEASTPTVTDCNFLNNTSGDLGGGIHNSTGGDAIITDCIFTGNTARRGGGISNFECSPSITRCTFSANVVSKNGLVDQAQGGGIRNSTSAHAEISDCIFMGNTAERGGGISNWDNCNPNISNCMFTDNEGINFGGGLYNLDNCDPTISNCTFTGNKAYHGGGISSWEYCNLTITNCTFSGNFAQETNGDGGGISNFWHVDSTITNCTFSGNIAGQGGGIFNEDFSNSTIDNCILWGNSTEIKNVDSSTSTVNYSCIEGGHAGTGNIIDNPLFVEANGPDNIYGTKDDDLRLLPGSPCIDASDNTAVPAGITTDLDDLPRFVNSIFTPDTGNGTAPIVDMGAYEWQCSSNVIYVDDSAPDGGDGGSWNLAYQSVQDALSAAANGNKIHVAQGTYKPAADLNRNVSFRLINGVSLHGGYAGYGAADPNERDIEFYETILSGDIGAIDDANDNSYHVVIGSGTDSTTVLDGFTITAGNANGDDPNNKGGGMYCNSGSPTVTNCIFRDNIADSRGGGMANYGNSDPNITNCNFLSNESGNFSGAIHNSTDSDSTITNCIFSGNTAGIGGAITNYNCVSSITDCTFSSNSANTSGGGMYNELSDTIITNCTFSSNSAINGGGMNNYNFSDSIITNCTFIANVAGDGGGMKNGFVSHPTITNCTFSGNSAARNGGGMYCNSGRPTVTNCTFSGNSAKYGDAILNYNNSHPIITNCIFWDNGAEIEDFGVYSASTVSYSCIQGGWGGAGSNNISDDPLFVDADGPDDIYGTEDDDLCLSPDSPCIDTGNNGAVPVDITTDLDGRDRIADGDCYITAVVDMGAYEFSWASLGDFDGQCDIDFYDLLIFVQPWLTEPGDPLWDPNCNISTPADDIINFKDYAVLAENWHEFCSVPDWVISYWKFDETEGLTAYDSIGNNDITLQDETMWTTEGKSNGALSFNGIDDYAEATDFSPDSNSFTILMWINPADTGNSQCFIGKHTAAGANIFLFGFWEDGYHVRIKGQTHTAGTKETGWQHLSVVVNPTGPSDCEVSLYKNGVALFSDVLFTDVVGDMSGKPWVLGQEWDDTSPSDFFDGSIDDLRFYDRVLSSEEILQLYYEFAD